MDVTVTVASQEEYDPGPFCFGGRLDDVMASLSKIRDEIPEPYRSTATCEISSVSGYEGTHYASISVSYRRPETPAETSAREESASRRRAEMEAAERRQYEQLSRKFGSA